MLAALNTRARVAGQTEPGGLGAQRGGLWTGLLGEAFAIGQHECAGGVGGRGSTSAPEQPLPLNPRQNWGVCSRDCLGGSIAVRASACEISCFILKVDLNIVISPSCGHVLCFSLIFSSKVDAPRK